MLQKWSTSIPPIQNKTFKNQLPFDIIDFKIIDGIRMYKTIWKQNQNQQKFKWRSFDSFYPDLDKVLNFELTYPDKIAFIQQQWRQRYYDGQVSQPVEVISHKIFQDWMKQSEDPVSDSSFYVQNRNRRNRRKRAQMDVKKKILKKSGKKRKIRGNKKSKKKVNLTNNQNLSMIFPNEIQENAKEKHNYFYKLLEYLPQASNNQSKIVQQEEFIDINNYFKFQQKNISQLPSFIEKTNGMTQELKIKQIEQISKPESKRRRQLNKWQQKQQTDLSLNQIQKNSVGQKYNKKIDTAKLNQIKQKIKNKWKHQIQQPSSSNNQQSQYHAQQIQSTSTTKHHQEQSQKIAHQAIELILYRCLAHIQHIQKTKEQIKKIINHQILQPDPQNINNLSQYNNSQNSVLIIQNNSNIILTQQYQLNQNKNFISEEEIANRSLSYAEQIEPISDNERPYNIRQYIQDKLYHIDQSNHSQYQLQENECWKIKQISSQNHNSNSSANQFEQFVKLQDSNEYYQLDQSPFYSSINQKSSSSILYSEETLRKLNPQNQHINTNINKIFNKIDKNTDKNRQNYKLSFLEAQIHKNIIAYDSLNTKQFKIAKINSSFQFGRMNLHSINIGNPCHSREVFLLEATLNQLLLNQEKQAKRQT